MTDKPQVLRTYFPHSLCDVLLLSIALILILLMAGCGGRSTAYYVLNSVPAAQKPDVSAEKKPVAGALTTVSIRQIDIPQYLDKPRMVSRDAGNRLKIAEYHQWGGQLRDNIARSMADNLADRLGSATVSMAPFPGSVRADIAVLLDIRQFERMPDGYIHMQVQWHVQGRDGAVFSRLEHLKSASRVGEDDYAGMAAAMSGLLGQLSDHLAEVIAGMKGVRG
ncbi:MAG: hypothetical protein COW19_01215 [Zetaproteobacteria bacterium CG12_big_fil_rev_8_21_14_0_65_55_1124]|nr:MAG: hypothetical protein AUJ58_08805 [Zetaproteobacteria bacterium CG1_02_55_237]PIS20490.1 MAG: hypothetical protein COT53_00260 [Zetaproteobacteria bacterium CG08_land_8_20_14_0_20_55_17]PIW43768.1 MAG: hypothetical protein COW19_01215 [Zetaproteobacteria bacterium CG12_big_fil_rev_8_21_14_0_65_55_1124]PIY53303.1 MAG: hypothetical protein COZ01_04415 [Zetaproteobacteria bacterium CG_4_10_14_0_8_um_filter_55_43]PIZ40124.1 MAG: hypothetical protein COY36_00560 [Zetaproteobacteria bacterium 